MLTRLAVATVFAIPIAVPASAQTVRFGLHYGVNLSNGGWEDERFGGQATLHLVGPLEAAGTFSVYSNWPNVTGYDGSAWHASLTLRARPHGFWSFASAGYGFVLLHSSLRNSSAQIDTSYSNFTDALVFGLEAPTPFVRPFADLYLIDILDRESAVGVNLLLGLQVALPNRRPT